jgi:hypothetical protein
MDNRINRMLKVWIGGFALVALGQATACTTDDSDPAEESGGTGGTTGGSAGTGGSSSGTGGSSAGTGGSSSTPGSVCEVPITIASGASGIATFDDYDGSADITTWSFPLGGDAAIGVFAGTFVYGDEPSGSPEAFDMVEGNDSDYALGISDTLAEEYGGGLGIWISECLDATAFEGISFWVRGNAPTGQAKISVLMEETTSETAAGASFGTCAGTEGENGTCIHPSHMFNVSDEWTQVQVPWSSFTGAASPGKSVTVDGHNIWQVQFDIGVEWLPDDTGEYFPTPAPYELVVDTLSFY